MNKYISFAFVVLALIASVSCGKHYDNHGSYGNLANLAIGSGSGHDHGHSHGHGHGHSYAAPAPAARAYTSHKHEHPAPKYSVQPAYAHELYPGQHNYQTYHSAPTYSQVALPVVPAAPVAKLYVPPQHSYRSSSYGSPAASYGGY